MQGKKETKKQKGKGKSGEIHPGEMNVPLIWRTGKKSQQHAGHLQIPSQKALYSRNRLKGAKSHIVFLSFSFEKLIRSI